MLRALTDRLYSASRLERLVQKNYPEDQVKLATAVTILKTKKETPVGWSLARFFQKRGNVVITDQRIIVRTNFLSLISLFWIGFLVYFVWQAYRMNTFFSAAFGVFAVPFLLQRLPFRVDVPLSEVQKVNFGTVQGTTLLCDILAVVLSSHTLQLVTAKRLPEELKDYLAASTSIEDWKATSTAGT